MKRHTLAGGRWLPLLGAACACPALSFILGYSAWSFRATRPVVEKRTAVAAPLTPPGDSTANFPPTAQFESVKVIPGLVVVPAGVVDLGGDPRTGWPARKISVETFSISETEVTNQQYGEFVAATGHRAPAGWGGPVYPHGTGTQPVTGVTWADAVEYCRWLSQQLETEVRLPSEAEWTLAARGPQSYRYPWGNEWDAGAAVSDETQGKPRPVRHRPGNRSPYGVYDMAGNVWEWTADEERDARGQFVEEQGAQLRVIKGGAVDEPPEMLTAISRAAVRPESADPLLGFRYVVARGKAFRDPMRP